MLSVSAWITIIIVVSMFVVMLTTKISAEFVFMAAVGLLYLTGVLDTKEAVAGLSDSSVVTIGILFVVVAGLVHTGVLQWISRKLLGVPKTWTAAVVRLMLPVAVLSSVLTNTTVVALFVKMVKVWAKKLGMSPSKLLIPLSYASGMGGVCTLIGTAPNLIISGMYADKTGESMGIFVTTLPGLFCLAVGVLSIIAMRKLLPERQSPEDAFASVSDYTAEMQVPSDSKYVGMTFEEAGLANVYGGSLIEVVRFDKEIISPVPKDEYIMGGDHLVYSGHIEEILNLRDTHGLVNADHHVFSVSEENNSREFRTAHVRFGSNIIGKSWQELSLKGREQMTLVAVSRHGQRIEEIPNQVSLHAGDTILLECAQGMSVSDDMERVLEFFDSDEVTSISWRSFVSTFILIGLMVLSALKIMPLLQSCTLAALLMVVFRCCSPAQAIHSINWNVLLVFAGSVVIGSAIQKTGLAELMAHGVLSLCGQHPLLIMISICVVGTFITEFISNTATAAILAPIMYSSAVALNCNPFPFMIALMIAVSSSFATPIGSPTHMLVYGPGGYRFIDFVRIGFWMNLIILAANIFIVNMLWPICPMNP